MARFATVDMKRTVSGMSINVRVIKRKRTMVRVVLATWLIRLATFVGGMKTIKIEEE